MTDEARPLRVFLCHASDDKVEVRKLSQRLQADGIDVWLDEEKLLPGQEWQHEIPQAVRDSDIILVCLSNKSTTKEGYVQKEITYALDIADEKPENTIFIIPLKLEECNLPGRLRRFQSADYFTDSTYQRLLKSFKLRADDLKVKFEPVKNKSSKTVQQFKVNPRLKNLAKTDFLEIEEGEPVPTGQTPTGIPVYTFAGIPFVKVSKGRFLMGSNDKDETARENEKPQHEVDIPYHYWIGRFQITNEMFTSFVRETSSPFTPFKAIPREKLPLPMDSVTWYDAMKFVQWLNRYKRNELPKQYVFNLPSETEWEKAARGIDGRRYPWGNHFGASILGLELCNTSEANYSETIAVGSLSPDGDSPYGACDMAGNVWEWTRSLWGKDINQIEYPYPSQNNRKNEDLQAPQEIYRIVRGGSYKDDQKVARCSYRGRKKIYGSKEMFRDYGFRVVVSPLTQNKL